MLLLHSPAGEAQEDSVRIDHVAHPSHSPAETHRFYSEVLGLKLVQAYSGTELMLVYEVPGGGSLVFNSVRGDARLSNDVEWERRHVGLTVGSQAEFDAWLRRLQQHAVKYRLVDSERIYFADPDGLVLEIEVASPTPVNPAASELLSRWLSE
jgi:catechol 2,3-dioxygenase-like lactoylglutathione lyase family enzyme